MIVGLALASCVRLPGDPATDLGARNHCVVPIEVGLGSFERQPFRSPVILEPGDGRYQISVGNNPPEIFAWVRAPGDDQAPEPALVPETAIDRAAEIDGVEWLINIGGELCP